MSAIATGRYVTAARGIGQEAEILVIHLPLAIARTPPAVKVTLLFTEMKSFQPDEWLEDWRRIPFPGTVFVTTGLIVATANTMALMVGSIQFAALPAVFKRTTDQNFLTDRGLSLRLNVMPSTDQAPGNQAIIIDCLKLITLLPQVKFRNRCTRLARNYATVIIPVNTGKINGDSTHHIASRLDVTTDYETKNTGGIEQAKKEGAEVIFFHTSFRFVPFTERLV